MLFAAFSQAISHHLLDFLLLFNDQPAIIEEAIIKLTLVKDLPRNILP